jgi:DUF1680 family protein
MFLLTGDARYVDVLERTLYNGVLSGVSLAGDTFFYPNPLESDGRQAFNQGAATRQPWFDSSCCPTNVARFIPSVPDYVYAVRGGALYVNLYVASEARVELDGAAATIVQKTGYPWDGHVELRIDAGRPRALELRLRIPGWARDRPVPSGLYRYAADARTPHSIRVNGKPAGERLDGGYAVLARSFSPGDVVTLELPMPARRVLADERVKDAAGRVALERGPLVYCTEAADHAGSVLDLVVPDDARLAAERRPDLLGGLSVLRATVRDLEGRPRELVAIPYYAWSHRGPGEMAVWLRRQPARREPSAMPGGSASVDVR